MIVAQVPLGPGPTLYTRIGDAFAWLCVAVAFAIGAISIGDARSPGRSLAAAGVGESTRTANPPST